MAKSKSKSKPKPKAKKPPTRKPTPAVEPGDQVRMLAPKKVVADYIEFIRACKSRTSEVGQSITTQTKKAQEQGLNVPAARIAERIYAKAQRDSIKGRVLWEDVQYYLTECTDFDKIAPAGMFKADEVRSTKGKRKKKNGEAQMDLSQRTDIEQPEAAEGAMPPAEEGDGEHVVH